MARLSALFVLIMIAFLLLLYPGQAQAAVPEIPKNIKIVPQWTPTEGIEWIYLPGFMVSWDPVSGEEISYQIYWGSDNSVSEDNHAGIQATGSTSFFHTSLVDESEYCYSIKACNGSGCSLLSPVVCETYLVGPDSISGPSTDCNGNFYVAISFWYSDRTLSLQRANNPSFVNPATLSISSTTHSRTENNRPSGTYYYRARAEKGEHVSAWSLTKSVTVTPGDPPPAPDTITYPSSVDGEFTVSWSPVNGADRYDLQFATDPAFPTTGGVSTRWRYPSEGTSYDLLVPSRTWYIRVRAVNDCGESEWKEGGPIVVNNSPRSGIHGWVHEGSPTGPALIGATITCAGKSTQSTSPDGFFSLSGIAEGDYEVRVSKIGYKDYFTSVDLFVGEDYEFNYIYLQKESEKPSVTQFTINDGDSITTTRTVKLSNSATGKPTKYKVSEFSDFKDAINWLPYTTTSTFLLSAGNGTKTIYFQVKNGAGKSNVKNDSILLDEPVKPTVTKFKINRGVGTTSDRTVTLHNTATGKPTHYMASEWSDFLGGNWKPYASAPSFGLSAGNGNKTVYFKVKNGSSESDSVSDNIIVDSCDNTIVMSLNSVSHGSIYNAGERDCYQVDVDDNGTLIVYTTGRTNTLGYLKDASCQAIEGTQDNDNGSNRNIAIKSKVVPGRYYISVRHSSPVGTGEYDLHVKFAPLLPWTWDNLPHGVPCVLWDKNGKCSKQTYSSTYARIRNIEQDGVLPIPDTKEELFARATPSGALSLDDDGGIIISNAFDSGWSVEPNLNEHFNTVWSPVSTDGILEVISNTDIAGPIVLTTNINSYFFSYDWSKISLLQWKNHIQTVSRRYNKRIGRLVIYAHGSPGKITMSDYGYFTTNNMRSGTAVSQILTDLGQTLDPDGNSHILLFSCRVGQDIEFVRRFAMRTNAYVHANSNWTGAPSDEPRWFECPDGSGDKCSDWHLDVVCSPQGVCNNE